MDGYYLTTSWFSFAAENNTKVDCKHTATYLYIVEQFNKRHWVKNIGLPTDFTMGALNIGSYKTYKRVLDDLVNFGFITIEWSKNQHVSNIVALVKITKASPKHIPKQVQSNDQSTADIIKHINNKHINNIVCDFFNSISDDQIDDAVEHLLGFKKLKEKSPKTETEKIDFPKLLNAINTITGRKFKIIDDATKRKFNARIKDGYVKQDILNTIKNAVKDDFHKENNFKFLTPEYFSRPKTIEKYSNITENNTLNKPKYSVPPGPWDY